jgi:hypothetical protein
MVSHPNLAPLAGNSITLIAPNSIPIDQLQGSDDITGGKCWEEVDEGDMVVGTRIEVNCESCSSW